MAVCYRVDKSYINLGRCGFAFIGNESIKAYQLLIYKQKNDIICSVKFSNEFQFNEREDNYATFFDDEKINWTIRFASDSDLKEFSQILTNHGAKVIKNIDVKNSPPLTKNIATSTNDSKYISTETEKSGYEKYEIDYEEVINKIDGEFSDSSNSNAKASLLSRMAKMGQKLLPNNNTSDGTDSDTEKERKRALPNRRSKRGPSFTTTPISDMQPSKSDNKTLPVSLPSGSPAFAFVNGQYVPIGHSPFVPPYQNAVPIETVPSPIIYSHSLPTQPSLEQLQMYFTENRTHNSEVRMNILRLTDKMEQVISKMNTIEISKSQTTAPISPNFEMDALKKENEKFKSIIEKLQKQIERYRELEKKHTDLLDQHIPMIKSNEEMKSIIATHIQSEMNYLKKIAELEAVINKQNEALKDYESKSRETIDIDETIKKLLNSLYSDINNQISDDESLYGRDIKKTLAQKFVDNAYSIIAVVGDSSKRQKDEND